MVKKYSTQEKGTYAIAPEKVAEFSEKFKALTSIPVKLEIEPIPLSLFGDVKLSVADMVNLDKFIVLDSSSK